MILAVSKTGYILAALTLMGFALVTYVVVAQNRFSWLFDAYPRTVRSSVEIRIYDANTATSGFRNLDIVDMRGKVVERLAHLIEPTSGLQTITVDAHSWTNGMYLLVACDNNARAGTIKLLKTD